MSIKCPRISTVKQLTTEVKKVLANASAQTNPQERLQTLAVNLHELAMETPLEIPSKGETILLRAQIIPILDEFREKYADLLSVMPNPRLVIQEGFNPESFAVAQDTPNESDESIEAAAINSQVKSEFFREKFGDALHVQLYYQRQVKNKFIDLFLLDRNNGTLVVSQLQMNRNVRKYKQELIDTIVTYLQRTGVPMVDSKGNPVNTTLYEKSKQRSIRDFLAIVESKLGSANVNKSTLAQAYNNYKQNKNDLDHSFIEAYNAYITLTNFDTVLKHLFPGIVEITNPTLINSNDFSNSKYKFLDKATNMWSNGLGDEVEDVADLVSTIVQTLVESSKVYTWKNANPMEDQYLSFAAFNATIGYAKKLALNPEASNIKLASNPNPEIASLDLTSLTEETRNFIATYTRILPGMTIADLAACIDSNPQRYFHILFDVLSNGNLKSITRQASTDGTTVETVNYTPVLDVLGTSQYFKNLIWTVNKEIFGNDPANTPRSIYNIQTSTGQGAAYTILTQTACSMFPEEFVQYYRDAEGNMTTRKLTGYGLYTEQMHVIDEINSKNTVFDTNLFKRLQTQYNIQNSGSTKSWKSKEITLMNTLSLSIPLSTGSNLSISIPLQGEITTNLATSTQTNAITVFSDPNFRKFVYDCLGIDLNRDSDFTSTLLDLFQTSSTSLQQAAGKAAIDLTRLCSKVIQSQYFNNVILPEALSTTGSSYTAKTCKAVIDLQYEKDAPTMDKDLGTIPLLRAKDAFFVQNLALARSILRGSLSAAQVRTGEGTNVANYALSNLKAQHTHQLFVNRVQVQNSAIKGLTYVSGITQSDGTTVRPCREVLTRREVKTDSGAKPCTKFSSGESYQFSFINDWVAAFAKPETNMLDVTGNGVTAFLTTINSDKSRIDLLVTDMNVESHQIGADGSRIPYKYLTNEGIESEMRLEFAPAYKQILSNITTDFSNLINFLIAPTQVVNKTTGATESVTNAEFLFGIPVDPSIKASLTTPGASAAETWIQQLNGLNAYFSQVKVKPEAGLKAVISLYNNGHANHNTIKYKGLTTDSHRNKPMKFGSEIHYCLDGNKNLTYNSTLLSLWARFAVDPQAEASTLAFVKGLGIYKGESKDGNPIDHGNYATIDGFFKYKDFLTAQDVLDSNFKVCLNNAKADNSSETRYLRTEYPSWVNTEGEMIIAKVGNTEITSSDMLHQYSPEQITLHPMLSKFNRMDYLFTQQYVLSTVGSHYVHKDKAKGTRTVIELEGARLNAANKRNNALTATVHKFQRGVIDGTVSQYRIAIMEDIKSSIYNPMGIKDTHKPLDGGTMCNGWVSILENNSLGSERAGWDKKPFGTFFFGEYAAGGSFKSASFACTNELMRKYPVYRNLQKNMSIGPWTGRREVNGADQILTDINVLSNDLGIFPSVFRQENSKYIPTEPIYYMKQDSQTTKSAYQLDSVEYLGNNQYVIHEIKVNKYGDPITGELVSRNVVIDNNWKIFTELFGGYESLEKDVNGSLQYSEVSLSLMARTLTNVGSWVKGAKPNKQSITQDDFYQPLKYSDIQYIANEGAIKSAYTNINTIDCLTKDVQLNFFTIPLAQLGIQLDKEHHADASDVSMPTQIIQACIDRGFTQGEAIEVYQALATLTGLATEQYIDEIKQMQNGGNVGALQTHAAMQILDEVLNSTGDNEAILNVLSSLVEKYKKDGKIAEADVVGKIAWSNSSVQNQVFSKIASKLTNTAIKMKFSGILSVICPTHGISQLHGNKTRSYYQEIGENIETEEVQLQREQEQIKDPANNDPRLIFDITRDDPTLEQVGIGENLAKAKEASRYNKASHIDFQHNYVIEFSDGTVQRKTINTVEDYEEVKLWLTHAINGAVVTKVYEDIITPRELAAANYRFKAVRADNSIPLTQTEFCLYDLQSTRELFKIRNLVDSISEEADVAILKEKTKVLYNATEYPQLAAMFNRIQGKLLADGIDPNSKEYYDRLCKYSEILLRKVLHNDLRKLSKNYKGKDRTVMCNNTMIEVDINTLEDIPYELIMPKVFKTTFGLTATDDLQKIKEDKDFFAKRAIDKLSTQQVADQYFTLELKSNNGQHQYILTKEAFERLQAENNAAFEKNPNFFTINNNGTITRINVQGKPMYNMASKKDTIYNVFGYEVIVTDDVNHYLKTLDYDHVVLSTSDVTNPRESIQTLIEQMPLSRMEATQQLKPLKESLNELQKSLKDTQDEKEKEAIVVEIAKIQEDIQKINDNTSNNRALDSFTRVYKADKTKTLWYNNLIKNAKAFKQLKSPSIIDDYFNGVLGVEGDPDEANHRSNGTLITKQVSDLIKRIVKDGDEQHTSFIQSLDVIAGRIPAQSQQSFMTQRVVAYDDRDANTARVSTFQLFLQGSKYIK